jgi:hypothetical protein
MQQGVAMGDFPVNLTIEAPCILHSITSWSGMSFIHNLTVNKVSERLSEETKIYITLLRDCYLLIFVPRIKFNM